ncbi:PucR family transcriptional regulator [Paenibacillus alkalitolerans]|uniref:PucR family transcriptional regulator n=1 Tax=Paenibacillus alkalitolerans TaxID=2799335 RepID=UPI0018F7A096|nr:helix-turn-helix domain-containing protein [Paenibacillus alkalitolerans]
MDWETLRERLERILQREVTVEKAPAITGKDFEPRANKTVFEATKDVRFVIYGSLTHAEEQLVSLLFDHQRSQDRRGRSGAGFSEEERQATLLSAWVMDRLEQGDLDAVLPESFAAWPSLSGMKIPVLLYGEYPERQYTSYGELRKLLQSFFDEEVTLIPLHNKQWVILGDEILLGDKGEEELEVSLQDFASGLQEMFSSEWVGECHVAITYPVQPSKKLIAAIVMLRETMELGRAYRFSSNIHMPWELRLEALLDKASDNAKRRFVDGVFKRAEPSLDAELITTLDTFFSENCNVSDTAKKLYIHRNTLLYRLDKFKQETGLDVRDFDHAVLVKLALLLYKVTKRK